MPLEMNNNRLLGSVNNSLLSLVTVNTSVSQATVLLS
jgi:hypothetical protein